MALTENNIDSYIDIGMTMTCLTDLFQNADSIMNENLSKILCDNKDTQFGIRYGFADISGMNEYQQKVPISDYSSYEKLCSAPQQFTVYPVENILITSGSMGKRKEFCLTKESLKRYGGYIHLMPYMLTGSVKGPHLHTSVFRPAVDGKNILSSAYFSYLDRRKIFDCEQFVGGRELMFSGDISDVAYVKAWLALGCANLKSIQSIFLYDVLLVLQYIIEKYNIILNDMRKHQISVALDDRVKELLLKYIPDEKRIDEAERILSGNTDEPIVPRLWKNIEFISGIGGDAFRLSTDALRIYTGNVPIYYFSYSSSECMMGVATKFDASEYTLMPQCAIYEFISNDGMVYTQDKLKGGEKYELVITTFSGLYRYRMGDIVEFVRYDKEAPVIKILGRKGNMINIAGEKIDEGTLQMSVYEVAKKLDFRVYDCSVGAVLGDIPSGYKIFLEADKEVRNAEKKNDMAEKCFDEVLRSLSNDYDDIRELGMLRKPEVVLLGRGTISKALGADDKHNKPHIILGMEQIKKIENILKTENDYEK